MGNSNEKGRVHRVFFSGTITGTDVADGTLINLCRLPSGARVLGGFWWNSANFGVAGTRVQIGIAGTAALFSGDMAGTAAAASSAIPYAAPAAGTGFVVLAADTTVIAKANGGVVVANGTYKGWLDYVLE